jgi:hypothetical protein
MDIRAYAHLVRWAVLNGYYLSVFDSEEWTIRKSQECDAIIKEIEGVDAIVTLRVYSCNDVSMAAQKAGKNFSRLGDASVCCGGVDPEESVIDYTCTSVLEKWGDIWHPIYNAITDLKYWEMQFNG